MRKRNKVMLIIGILFVVIVLGFVFADGTFLPRKYESVGSDAYLSQLEDDQYRMIVCGIRAASSHNMQPWLVKRVDADTTELYADMDKALGVVDSDNKQLLISQGTFIESFAQGALQYGYGTQVAYHEPDLSQDMPLIATIKTYKDEQAGAADAVSGSTYAAASGEMGNLEETLDECMGEYAGFSYTIIESDSDVQALKDLLLEGTIIESRDEAAMKELLGVFRWTEWEKNEFRYGLSLSTLPGIAKPFVQPLMKLISKDWKGFGDSSIKQFEERLAAQDKYILIKCGDPGSVEYINTGRIYQRLVSESGAYDLRPTMQVLEDFDAMKSLNLQFQQAYGEDAEVVMVIGVQEKTGGAAGNNPRHLVEDILVQ